jgi:hypothetical protein
MGTGPINSREACYLVLDMLVFVGKLMWRSCIAHNNTTHIFILKKQGKGRRGDSI